MNINHDSASTKIWIHSLPQVYIPFHEGSVRSEPDDCRRLCKIFFDGENTTGDSGLLILINLFTPLTSNKSFSEPLSSFLLEFPTSLATSVTGWLLDEFETKKTLGHDTINECCTLGTRGELSSRGTYVAGSMARALRVLCVSVGSASIWIRAHEFFSFSILSVSKSKRIEIPALKWIGDVAVSRTQMQYIKIKGKKKMEKGASAISAGPTNISNVFYRSLQNMDCTTFFRLHLSDSKILRHTNFPTLHFQ